MKSRGLTIAAAVIIAGMSTAASAKTSSVDSSSAGIYAFTLKDIEGKDVPLSRYRGKVLLIVNVASKCGFTPQYEGLERLWQRHGEDGLVVLGFPANNFMNQEPGTNQQIRQFCSSRYSVSFPMFSKISVKGEDKHPLYGYLTAKETNPEFGGEITWNFNKFLVDREGNIIDRFGSATKPESKEIVQAVEEALAH